MHKEIREKQRAFSNLSILYRGGMLLNQLLQPFFCGVQKPSIFSDRIWLVAMRARKGEILTQVHVIVIVYFLRINMERLFSSV